MPREYSLQDWDRARALVVEEHASYEQAAEATGIGLSALQKRAAKEGWKSQQVERLERTAGYRQRIVELKHKMLEKAIGSTDPQDIHAWQAVERAYPEHRYGELGEPEKRALVAVFLDQVVEYFKGADTNVLAQLHPHLVPLAEQLLHADWRA